MRQESSYSAGTSSGLTLGVRPQFGSTRVGSSRLGSRIPRYTFGTLKSYRTIRRNNILADWLCDRIRWG